jgi:hypothetical protein
MGPGVVKPLPVQQAPGSTSVDAIRGRTGETIYSTVPAMGPRKSGPKTLEQVT